jgi:hypothetical protein
MNVSARAAERDVPLFRFREQRDAVPVTASVVPFESSPLASAFNGTATEPAYDRLRRFR